MFKGCLCISQTNSLPSAYLKEKFTQGEPIDLSSNIKLNFMNLLKKFINPNLWSLVVSQEAIFNKIEGIPHFSPIDKRCLTFDKENIKQMVAKESIFFPKAISFF